MRVLERLQITIEPTNYDSLSLSFTSITVTATVNGQRFSYRRELKPDHFNSLFDTVFDEAKTKIKEAILNHGKVLENG